MSFDLSFIKFFYSHDLLWIFPCTFLVGIVSFSLLLLAGKSHFHLVRSLFYIPARKSISNAVQLGGLPLSVTILLGLSQVLMLENSHSLLSPMDHSTLKYWFLGAGGIVFYGYFDDRFELRPIIKLGLQLFSICIFAMLESRILFPKWGALSFIILSFIGLGVVNGSNLLDGLDTLTIKLAAVTFGSFLIIGINYHIIAVVTVGLICLSAVFAFYFFNKEPAKVHLGEIGGSFIGFCALLLSCLTYTSLLRAKFGHINAFAVSMLPLLLPIVELSVSFLRRIYNKKSPFKGDKYHIHHILRNYHGLSPSHASSYFALSHCFCVAVGFGLSHYLGPLFGLIASFTLYMVGYIAIGKKYWKGQDSYDFKSANLFEFLLKKDVSVINSLEVDDFKIQIVEGGDERELVAHKKKAA